MGEQALPEGVTGPTGLGSRTYRVQTLDSGKMPVGRAGEEKPELHRPTSEVVGVKAQGP